MAHTVLLTACRLELVCMLTVYFPFGNKNPTPAAVFGMQFQSFFAIFCYNTRMTNGFSLRRIIMAGLAAAFAVPVPGGESEAGSRKHAYSQNPYWAVGQYNNVLSDACQRNFFNQKQIQNLTNGYHGDQGMGITGIATREWNLRDPKGLATQNIT